MRLSLGRLLWLWGTICAAGFGQTERFAGADEPISVTSMRKCDPHQGKYESLSWVGVYVNTSTPTLHLLLPAVSVSAIQVSTQITRPRRCAACSSPLNRSTHVTQVTLSALCRRCRPLVNMQHMAERHPLLTPWSLVQQLSALVRLASMQHRTSLGASKPRQATCSGSTSTGQRDTKRGRNQLFTTVATSSGWSTCTTGMTLGKVQDSPRRLVARVGK